MKTDLLNEMKQDAERPVPQDRLEAIRKKVVEMRDIEAENASLSERMDKNGKRLRELRDKEIVDLLDAARLKGFTVAADGNSPAYEVEVAPYYHANIPEETAEQAYEWLRKKNHGDIIKAQYTIEFGRGQDKAQKSFEALLNKSKIPFTYKYGVPWNTLTAFVREQIEERKATLPLKLLGATVGRVAKVVKQKKGK
jgi:hypothetical protein